MANKFKKLSDPIDRDLERRARVDEHKRAMEVALELAGARGERGVSQTELAKRMKVSQANISRIEREGDIHLSTLAGYVGALGGELKIEAVFGNRSVSLVGAAPRRATRKKQTPARASTAAAKTTRGGRSGRKASSSSTTSKKTASRDQAPGVQRSAKR